MPMSVRRFCAVTGAIMADAARAMAGVEMCIVHEETSSRIRKKDTKQTPGTP